MARVADIARNLDLCGSVRAAVKWSYLCYVRATKLMHRFPEALQLVENLDDEVASESSSDTRGAFSITRYDEAVFSSADKHDVLPYTKVAGAHKLKRNQKESFIGRAFYSCAVLILQELRNLRCTARQNHLFGFDGFSAIGTSQIEAFLLSVKKMSWKKTFSFLNLRAKKIL